MKLSKYSAVTIAVALTFGAAGLVTAAPASAKAKHTTTTTKPKKKATPKLKTPHIGQLARDGGLGFRVKGVQCGVTQLGDPSSLGTTAPAGAMWCLVTMSVNAEKGVAGNFFAANQKAVDGKGRQLTADSEAAIYIPNDTAALDSQVNPGITITAVVPYELPTSGRIAKFILHDSAFSGGVTVYNVGP